MHVMSPLRLQYGRNGGQGETRTYIAHASGQECVTMGRQEEIAERCGVLGIPTGTHNRWCSQIELQKVCRREGEGIKERRCVCSTTCNLNWQPSCGQWGEQSRHPGSALTQTNDKSAFALYWNNTLPFQSNDCSYHTNHNAHTRIDTFAVCFFLSHIPPTHTHTRRSLTNVGTDAPHQTALALCSLRNSREDSGIPLTKIRHCSPLLSLPHQHTCVENTLSFFY